MSGAVVQVIVTGPTGTGKSAIYGEIEIALKALGVTVVHGDEREALAEQRSTHADYAEALALYEPTVVLHEVNGPTTAGRAIALLALPGSRR